MGSPDKAIATLHAQAADCRRCPLWRGATRVVFGAGPADAPVVIVGEQPGDEEDLAGEPFIGPSGRLLDRALREAGVDRRQSYVTNAVKHFKFVIRGKRRLHQKPDAGEVDACRWWLEAEFQVIRPELVVALGVTAAQSVLQRRRVTLGPLRGRTLPLGNGRQALITVHPYSVLRQPDSRARADALAALVADLGRIPELVPAVRL